jgi:hypothetical protein
MATTLAAAISNTLSAVQAQVSNLNAALKSNYLTTFANWAQSVLAGRVPNTNPPQPPNGYVVSFFNDPTTGPGSFGPYGDQIVQWPYPAIGTDPVCSIPAIPSISKTLGLYRVGVQMKDAPGLFARLDGDTTPAGTTTPDGTISADGISGRYLKIGEPFGTNAANGEVGGVFLKLP